MNAEDGATAWVRLVPDAPALGFHDLPGYVQAEPQACRGVMLHVLHLEETLEDAVPEDFGYAAAAVHHRGRDAIRQFRQMHLDLSGQFIRELDRVIH